MLLMPMYRPDAAFGMMSVISAQSTARNVPDATPIATTPSTNTSIDGENAVTAMPTAPIAQAA